MRKSRLPFVRFRDLNRSHLNVDFHVHTTRTDGEATIEKILELAREKRLSAIAFTEHVRKETHWFSEFKGSVQKSSQFYPEIKVYTGCETKALDKKGTLDLSEEILQQCDIILGSVHRFPDGTGGYVDFSKLPPEQLAEIECEMAVGLLRNAPIDVLAHPGGMYQRRHGPYPEYLFRRILTCSLEREIAVEISTSYLVDFTGFLKMCGEINPFVSIGSDLHKLEAMGTCRDRLMSHLGFPK